MEEPIRVNFHCHSIFSDGELSPEVLAASLFSAGVRYAALTDHDTIEGLPRFQEALKKFGIGYLPGVEITTRMNGREVHLLGYGIDLDHSELAGTLISLRQARSLEVHSIAGSLRKAGNRRSSQDSQGGGRGTSPNAAPAGMLEVGEAIALIHRAGGRAFWAHPLKTVPELDKIEGLIRDLKKRGLDGIEVDFSLESDAEQSHLCNLAKEHGLLLSAGTDFHGSRGPGSTELSVLMPREEWSRFRQAVFDSHAFLGAGSGPDPLTPTAQATHAGRPHHFRQRPFILRIVLPTILTVFLFLAAFWAIILPMFEDTLLDRKREMIRELTNSAWSILASYHRDEVDGLLSREEAQASAISRIESLRYGPDGKDYFWIQDMQPRMVMHPYRTDLNGQDLSNFADPRGVAIFVEFASLVKRDGEGYVDYVWQWKDDPQRLEPKESFVKGFEPWGWIIGTGIYTDDVFQEIARIKASLTNTSLVVSGMIILLLLFVLQQALRIERERQEVLDDLQESTGRFHALVEATNEGTLLVLDGRCRYANPTFLNMLGYSDRELVFLDLEDLLPADEENAAIREGIRGLQENRLAGGPLEGSLKRKDGSVVECILSLNQFSYGSQEGLILLAVDITRQPASISEEGLVLTAQDAPVGIFRAQAGRRGVILDANPAARSILEQFPLSDRKRPALADLFPEPGEYNEVIDLVLANGEANDHLLHAASEDAGVRYFSLNLKHIQDESQGAPYLSGSLVDITAKRKRENEREGLIEKLQASLLFLHEPVMSLGRNAVICRMDASIGQVSRMITARKMTAALIASSDDTVIGIVTDHDLRARVLAGDVDRNSPVHTVMSAPVIRIPENALIYEALLKMEENGVRHLAIEDENNRIVSLVDSNTLVQFQRYGPIVLSREIWRAGNADDVTETCSRIPTLARSILESSTRPRYVTSMLTSNCDAAAGRLIQLAIEEMGEPPAKFCFVAMGSQGRQEQTLLTDQDNGILYLPGEGGDAAAIADYFLGLGSRVCENLDRAGYALCRGRVMANNPRWCRSLSEWLAGFDDWIHRSEAQEIIDLSIFFDFRPVYGDPELAHEMRRHIYSAQQGKAAFFGLFAQNALLFKPPFRLLSNVYLGGGAVEHTGEINLKDAMMPIVSFARLYALQHQVNATHTQERIEVLAERDVIPASSRDEISAAYDFLMQLRLETQLAAMRSGQPASNIIHPGKLTYIQRELLKQAFSQISAVQKKVSYDYLGGV